MWIVDTSYFKYKCKYKWQTVTLTCLNGKSVPLIIINQSSIVLYAVTFLFSKRIFSTERLKRIKLETTSSSSSS